MVKLARVIVLGGSLALAACTALLGIDGEILDRSAEEAETGGPDDSSTSDAPQTDGGDLFEITTKSVSVIQGSNAKLKILIKVLPGVPASVTLGDLPPGVGAPVLVPPAPGEHTIVLDAAAFAKQGGAKPSITMRSGGREQTSTFELTVTGPMDRSYGDAGLAPLGFSLRLEAPVPVEELGSIRRDNVGLDVLDGGAALVAFSTSDGLTGPAAHAVVARLQPNGAIDTGFADAGRLAFAPDTRAFDMITLGDGTHLVAGVERIGGNPRALMALVDPSSAAVVGPQTKDLGPSSNEGVVSVVPVGPSGAVGLSAIASADYALVRTTMAPAMEDAGALNVNMRPHVLVRESDSKVFVAGISQGNQNGRIARRFVADGASDPTFTTTVINGRPNDLRAGSVVDGGAVFAGASAVGGGSNVSGVQILRVQYNGGLDPGFGSVAGASVEGVGGAGAVAIHALVVEPSGHFVVGGSASVAGVTNALFARFNPKGLLDTKFGNGGFMLVPFGRPAQVRRLALQGNAVLAAVVVEPSLASEGQDVVLVRVLP